MLLTTRLMPLSAMARRLRVTARWLRGEAEAGRVPCIPADLHGNSFFDAEAVGAAFSLNVPAISAWQPQEGERMSPSPSFNAILADLENGATPIQIQPISQGTRLAPKEEREAPCISARLLPRWISKGSKASRHQVERSPPKPPAAEILQPPQWHYIDPGRAIASAA